mgnify:CR=1 FL=1
MSEDGDIIDNKVKEIYTKYIGGGSWRLPHLNRVESKNIFIIPIESKNYDDGKPTLDEFTRDFKQLYTTHKNKEDMIIGTYHGEDTDRYSIDVSTIYSTNNFSIRGSGINDGQEAFGYIDSDGTYANVLNPLKKSK